MRVVLVEDNDDDADLIARGVKRFDGQLDLVRFRTIAGAVEHLIQEHEAGLDPQLVLVDGKVAGLDAGEFFEAADQAGLSHLSFVVLTGSSDSRTFARLTAAGAKDVYTKPTEYTDFQQSVADILSRFCGIAPGSSGESRQAEQK